MNEYSRIKQENSYCYKSKSLYLADLSFTSQIPELPPKSAEPKQNQHETVKTTCKTHDPVHQCGQEDGAGEIFGVILSRSRSVSATAPSHESKAEKQRGLMQSAAKVTLTMRRSFSASGGYCRIHHQHDIITDDENMNSNVFQKRTVKKKGRILKACRRLLGL